MNGHPWLEEHLQELTLGVSALRAAAPQLQTWGLTLAERLAAGHRLLTAGNGGSAAEAQHLTAELVGRFLSERRPLSAICLNSETSSRTAILNDYGPDELFARQVQAHGRSGDIAILLSTSGRSSNLLAAARRAREQAVEVWAMTGARPNPLAELADQAFCVPLPSTAAVQEVHLVAVHAICAALDSRLADPAPPPATRVRAPLSNRRVPA